MNMLKKSIALLIVMVLVMAAMPAVLAVEAMPGNTVTVYLNMGTGYGIDGSITISDPHGIISGVNFVGPSGYDGFVERTGSSYYTYYSKNNVASAGSCTITARVTLKNNASLAGKSATIYFSGTTSQAVEGSFSDVSASASAVITMMEAGPSVNIDYTELKKQIGIAEDLNKIDYTADSWKALQEALANAKDHLTSDDQEAVDQAAKELADAIAALVKMDHSKLEDAIQQGNAFIENDEVGKLWKELMDAIADANSLLGCGDQAAEDAAAEKILGIIEELKKALGAEENQDAVEPTTCEPTGPFCNIDIHKLWPILFFISLVGNILFVIERKKSDKK